MRDRTCALPTNGSPLAERRTIAVGVIRPTGHSAAVAHSADRLRSELAYQLSRVTPQHPLTPAALTDAWGRAFLYALPDQTAAEQAAATAAVVLSMPRPQPDATCGQYAALLRTPAPVTT